MKYCDNTEAKSTKKIKIQFMYRPSSKIRKTKNKLLQKVSFKLTNFSTA